MPNLTFFSNVRQNAGLADLAWRKFVVRWSLVSLGLIAIATYFSYGMFKLDEYYQIIEFVGLKLGKTPATELPWEYQQKIRPWLQPAIYYVAAKGLIGLGVKNPFTLVVAFRAISGFFGWLAVTALMFAANTLFSDDRRRRLAVIVLALLWLVPYLAVRTSGESMSCSFLSLGAAVLLLGSTTATSIGRPATISNESIEPRRAFSPLAVALSGICFGLAFEFRLQTVFGAVGALGWICLASADRWPRTLMKLALGCGAALLPIALGTVVDRWGYGVWTFAPWNYFHADVVLGIPNNDGVSPIWGYFVDANATPLAPLTLLWTLAMLVTWARFRRSIVTWITLPFFVGHSIFPHKEVRYLFPMVLLAALFFIFAFVPQENSAKQPAWLRAIWNRRNSWFAKLLYGINVVGLMYGCVVAKQPSVNFQKFVYDRCPNGCTLYLLGDECKSPYENVGLNMYFYRPPNFSLVRVADVKELKSLAAHDERDSLVVRDRVTPWDEQNSIAPEPVLIYRTYPAWIEDHNWFGWLMHSKRFSLYAVQSSGNAVGEQPARPKFESTAARMTTPDATRAHE